MLTVIKKLPDGVLLKCPCGKEFMSNTVRKGLRCSACTSKSKEYIDREGNTILIEKLKKKERLELFNVFISALDEYYERTDGNR